MTVARLKNTTRNGIYSVDLREIQAPDRHESGVIKGKGVMALKLDFHPVADNDKDFTEIGPDGNGTSQMYLHLSLYDVQEMLKYLKTTGIFESPWFKDVMEGKAV